MTYRVLLVEDDERDIELVREAAERAGFDAEFAIVRDADTAIDRLDLVQDGEEPWPDALLLDLDLAGSRGDDVLRYLRQSYLNLPVIVLTGSTAAQDRQRSAALDATAYFIKPGNLAGLVAVMHEVERIVRSAA